MSPFFVTYFAHVTTALQEILPVIIVIYFVGKLLVGVVQETD